MGLIDSGVGQRVRAPTWVVEIVKLAICRGIAKSGIVFGVCRAWTPSLRIPEALHEILYIIGY